MTDPTMALRALLEKSSDTDLLRDMVDLTAQRLMELEAESLTGAPYGKRSNERVNQRSGFVTEPGKPVPARDGCCARAEEVYSRRPDVDRSIAVLIHRAALPLLEPG